MLNASPEISLSTEYNEVIVIPIKQIWIKI